MEAASYAHQSSKIPYFLQSPVVSPNKIRPMESVGLTQLLTFQAPIDSVSLLKYRLTIGYSPLNLRHSKLVESEATIVQLLDLKLTQSS